MSTISVHVIVRGANGRDTDARVTDFILPGDSIPERINVIAAEAASMAYTGLNLTERGPSHRDRTIRDRTR